MSDYNFVFFGVLLTPFIVGVIALLRNETNISDYILDWAGALAFAIAAVLSMEVVQLVLAGSVPLSELLAVPMIVQMLATFLGVLLSIKGYWPSLRAKLGPKIDDYNFIGTVRGIYFSKY